MRTLLALALVLAISGVVLAASGPINGAHSFNPASVDSFPDAYGYYTKSSFEPGGPTFQWRDITTTGTQVTGLADDNYVGPFSIGINFHYYWYEVNQMWIGSNGYLEFSSPFNFTAPFPNTVPLPSLPNDFVGPYIADWDLTNSGAVYRWTNNVDSAIVAWVGVPEYGASYSSHTFEVILTNTDSSITYMFGPQIDVWPGARETLVAIENVSGMVGLMYDYDNPQFANSAVKYYYPPVVTYQAHDLAAHQVGNATSQAFFMMQGQSFTPMGIVKNFGNQNETSYTVRFRIRQDVSPYTILYDQTMNGGALAFGQQQTFNFSPAWNPSVAGHYLMQMTVTLNGDLNPANDSKNAECGVMVYPGAMLYDDGESNAFLNYSVGYSAGTRFVPPAYPVKIDSISYYTDSDVVGDPFIARILDDNGPGGSPRTVMFEQNFIVGSADPGWRTLDMTSHNITFSSGAFYVSFSPTTTATPGLGLDNTITPTGPYPSRQTWDFGGTWVPSSYVESSDFMIRARISYDTGVLPDQKATPVNYALDEAQPNPFNSSTVINFSLPAPGDVSLVVYDQSGRVAARLVSGWRPAGTHQAVFEGGNLSSGVYLVKMHAGTFIATRKVVLIK